eukprot:568022-Pyramimonas_sp.AAC.1
MARGSFELLEAIKDGADASFLADLHAMMRSATHRGVLVDNADKTLECRAFAFKLISASLRATERTACLRQKVEPAAFFRCLFSDAGAEEVKNKPPCPRDPWSKRFVENCADEPGGSRRDEARSAARFQRR